MTGAPAPTNRLPQLIVCLVHHRSVLRALKMRMPRWLVASWDILLAAAPLAAGLGGAWIPSGLRTWAAMEKKVAWSSVLIGRGGEARCCAVHVVLSRGERWRGN